MGVRSLLQSVYQWKIQQERFKQFVQRYNRKHQGKISDCGKKVGILVTPWFLTTVPWYSITLGLMLQKRGAFVTFIIDDLPFGKSPALRRMQLKGIKTILSQLLSQFPSIFLSEYQRLGQISDQQKKDEIVSKLVDMCTIHYMRGESLEPGRKSYEKAISKQLDQIYTAVENLIWHQNFEYYLIPGGILGSTGIFCELAKLKPVRIASYDSGDGVMLIAANGIAAQLNDIPIAFYNLKADIGNLAYVHNIARKTLVERQNGNDPFSYQKTVNSNNKSKGVITGGVLIPLNSSWDSAALGLHNVFRCSTEWVLETVEWVINHTSEEIIVRQHPAERHKHCRSNDDFSQILKDHFGDHPQVSFIAAEDPVNTYEIIRRVKVIVVHTSTVGIEAAVLGKCVITSSDNYYSELGFVNKARSKKEYFEMIKEGIKSDHFYDEGKINNALECYYITQKQNWLFTDFDPFIHFNKWSCMDLESLYNDHNISLMLSSINNNIPLPWLRHIETVKNVSSA